MKENRGLRVGFSPLAGISAGTAGVLFAFGVLCLAWRQVSGHVSAAITMLAYVIMFALAVVAGAGAWLVVVWVAHRHRNPELLVRRADRAQAVEAEAITAAPVLAELEPPRRVYLNVTDDQLAALIRQHPEED